MNIEAIKTLLADDHRKWTLDSGDWMGYVEELVDEIERLQADLRNLVKDSKITNLNLGRSDDDYYDGYRDGVNEICDNIKKIIGDE